MVLGQWHISNSVQLIPECLVFSKWYKLQRSKDVLFNHMCKLVVVLTFWQCLSYMWSCCFYLVIHLQAKLIMKVIATMKKRLWNIRIKRLIFLDQSLAIIMSVVDEYFFATPFKWSFRSSCLLSYFLNI